MIRFLSARQPVPRNTALAWLLVTIGLVGGMPCGMSREALGQQTSVRAEEPSSRKIAWLTGDAFLDQLHRNSSLHWEGDSLRDALQRLSRHYQIAIFLDRNIDPDQVINLSLDDQPLLEILRQIARRAGGDLGFVGPVVYIGPTFVSHRIATVAETLNQRLAQRLPARHGQLLRPDAMHWETLAEPQMLIAQRLSAAGFTSNRLQMIPHDVWPAYDLPPMTWAEQMTLLLAGFRLSFSIDPQGREVQWTQLPQSVALRREYSAPGDVANTAREWEQLFPQAYVEIEGAKIIVRSTLEDHWEVARRLKPSLPDKDPERTDKGKSLFTLTVKNKPVRAVLEAVAQRLECQLQIDQDVVLDDSELTSFTVQDASPQELLTAIVREADIVAELQEGVIRVRKK